MAKSPKSKPQANAPAKAADPDLIAIEGAWRRGSIGALRRIATSGANLSPEAKERVEGYLARSRVEPVQVAVGLAALVLVLIVALVTLTTPQP